MVGPSQVSDTWGSGVLKLCLFPTQRLRMFRVPIGTRRWQGFMPTHLYTGCYI
jgi:hypothetical protein